MRQRSCKPARPIMAEFALSKVVWQVFGRCNRGYEIQKPTKAEPVNNRNPSYALLLRELLLRPSRAQEQRGHRLIALGGGFGRAIAVERAELRRALERL